MIMGGSEEEKQDHPIETLALENTIARNRALGGFAATGLKLLEASGPRGTARNTGGLGRAPSRCDRRSRRRRRSVTAGRRLEALEAALSPTELVLRWLAEAHAYDDFSSYVRMLLDVDPGDFPMDRLAREARASAQQRSRGLPRAEADRAMG